MKTIQKVGVALVALLLISLPALALTPGLESHRLEVTPQENGPSIHKTAGSSHQKSGSSRWGLIALGALALGIARTVTQTYAYPGSGTVPATAAQAAGTNFQSAEVNFADADTVATVTHNWGLGTTGAFPNTGQFLPQVILVWSSAGTAFPALAVSWTNGNTLTLSKGNTSTGSGGTVVVSMRRPHSLGQ